MDFRYKITAAERENLYQEVWTEPVTTVSKRYNLSDNGLRKHCKRLGIPLPPPGYWARRKSDPNLGWTPLPQVTGELRHHVREYVIKYRSEIDTMTDLELENVRELEMLQISSQTFIRNTCSKIQVKGKLRNPHHLVAAHMEELEYRKKRDKALKRVSYSSTLYMNEKANWRENKPLLPVAVSEANLNRSYRILDAIITTIESMEGFSRVSQHFGQADAGSFVVLLTSFQFYLQEEPRRKNAKNVNHELPRLILSMEPRSWFHDLLSDTMEYKDYADKPLEEQLGKVIEDMFVVANKLIADEKLRERKKIREEEEQTRIEHLEKMRKGELSEIKLLEQTAADWDKAEKIRRFAEAMERKIVEVGQGENENIVQWLQWARDKADWLDPLTEKTDDLLGRSKTIFEIIE